MFLHFRVFRNSIKLNDLLDLIEALTFILFGKVTKVFDCRIYPISIRGYFVLRTHLATPPTAAERLFRLAT